MLAVRARDQRRGYGRQLKELVLRQAATEGIDTVASKVHRLNVGMLELNRRLGASVVPVDDPDYVLCMVPIVG